MTLFWTIAGLFMAAALLYIYLSGYSLGQDFDVQYHPTLYAHAPRR